MARASCFPPPTSHAPARLCQTLWGPASGSTCSPCRLYMWVLEPPKSPLPVDAWIRACSGPCPKYRQVHAAVVWTWAACTTRRPPWKKPPPSCLWSGYEPRDEKPARFKCSTELPYSPSRDAVPPKFLLSPFSLSSPWTNLPRLRITSRRSVDARSQALATSFSFPPPARLIIASAVQPRPVEARIFLNIIIFLEGVFDSRASIEPR